MMKSDNPFVAVAWLAVFLMPCDAFCADGPLPEFTFKGVAVDPHSLTWAPGDDIEHPAFINMEGLVEKPLGKYYLYYGPHKHEGVGVLYADDLTGPWKEYEGNPVVKGAAAPDVRWVKEKGRFQLWAHSKNSQTEMWTSPDGLNFEHHSISIQGSSVGTKNATYTRFYEYPIEKHGNRYVMLYVGYNITTKLRSLWLAHSTDAENWKQLQAPLVMPGEGETDALYDPCLFQWKGKNYIVYADNNVWRGGTLKYVEVDQELNSVQNGGTRYTLLEGPEKVQGRLRSPEFLVEDGRIHMLMGAGKTPRLCAYATANLDGTSNSESSSNARPSTEGDVMPDLDEPPVDGTPKRTKQARGKNTGKGKKKEGGKTGPNALDVKLDEVLKNYTLYTVYETAFDEPIKMVHESELADGGSKIIKTVPKGVDWILEGKAKIEVKNSRLHITNDSDHAVLWNVRTFPESFVAEWDFKHEHPTGTAILFFAAHTENDASIFTPGLPIRGGRFGNYSTFDKGRTMSYHSSYSATDLDGTPRNSLHLKKNGGKDMGKGLGISPIDGNADRPYRVRIAKIGPRIIIEVDNQVSVDFTDESTDAFKGGQIGFRQMRHTKEASYSGFKVQAIN